MEVHVALAALIMAALAVETCRAWFAPRNRGRRALRRARNIPIAEIKHGEWARITGEVSPREPLLTSPVTGRSCIGYRLEVEEFSRRAQPIVKLNECGGFSIADQTGRVNVDGPFLFVSDEDGGWLTMPRASLGVVRDAGVETSGVFLMRRFVYREAVLRPGDRVTVLGLAFVEPDPAAMPEGHRSPPLTPRMRGSVSKPIVVADAGGAMKT